MGRLLYGASRMRIDVEDRLLAHIEVVILSKLRRSEGFALSWVEPVDVGSGRRLVWLNPTTELVFEYFGSRPVDVDRGLLEELNQRANSNGGLNLHELTSTSASAPSSGPSGALQNSTP